MLARLQTKSRSQQLDAADVIRDFSNGKMDREGVLVAWESTEEGQTLVVHLPAPKVDAKKTNAKLLEQLKRLVVDLAKKKVAPKKPVQKKSRTGDDQEKETAPAQA